MSTTTTLMEHLDHDLGVVRAHEYADALIEIASMFEAHGAGMLCRHCFEYAEGANGGCDETCPGLLARRALGVA